MSLNTSRVLRVASFEYYPYQSFDAPGLNVPVKGFNGHVVRAISQSLQLSYNIIQSNAWGLQNDNGSWTGAMGRIERDEADMTLCPTNPTAAKLLVGEQTYPLHPIELLILNGRRSKYDQNTFGILLTFDRTVWAILVLSLLFMALLMSFMHFVISRISPDTHYPGHARVYNFYVFMLTENTFNEATAYPPPETVSMRLIWMFWYLGISLILMNAFAGQLKASMMFKPEKARIENLLDLYKSKHDVYLPKDSAGEAALKTNPAVHVQKMYSRILSDKTYGTPERIIQDDILEMVLSDRASLITSRPAEAMVSEEKCSKINQGEFYISERPVLIFNAVYHLNYRLPSKLRRDIQERIEWMADSGLLDRWWREIAGAWNGCSRGDRLDIEALSVSDFEMIALLWGLGIGAASVVFLIERTCIANIGDINCGWCLCGRCYQKLKTSKKAKT